MNVLVSLPEEKLDAMKQLGIIDDNTVIYHPSKELKQSYEQAKPALQEIQNFLEGKSTMALYDDEEEEEDVPVESIGKFLRDASSDSEADEICIGDSWYIAYNHAQDNVFIQQGKCKDGPWIYLLEAYPFSTEASANKAVETLGYHNLLAFFDTINI